MKKMEGGDRPHRSGSSSSSSELFICFTSRPSSSMKISSKSILSPGRTDKLREGASVSTLPSSLSRRLRSNGSMKGGQSSPMFPTGSKKKGCGFENPEPSSPKVTCIGQVRVKTKKQGKKMRTRSKRRSGSGDGSFRKMEQNQEGERQMPQQESLPSRNGRWVHLPLSICEALRAFGAEFNCFVPCGSRSLCSSSHDGTEREKGQKQSAGTTTTTSSCGAVFARWLMALQESEEGKRREVVEEVAGSIVEEENDKVKAEGREGNEKAEVEIEEDEEDESICIPPKNALLLMRCRSEPFRMASLANRFWDSPAQKEYQSVDRNADEDDEDEEDDEEDLDEEQRVVEESRQKEAETFEEAIEDDLGELLQHIEVTAEELEVPVAVHEAVKEQKGEEEVPEIDSAAVILEEQENTPKHTELPMPEREEEEVKEAQKTEQEEEGAKFQSTQEKETENQFQSTQERETENLFMSTEGEKETHFQFTEEENKSQLESCQGKENEIQFQSTEGEEAEARETQLQKPAEEQGEAKESEFQPTVEEEREEKNAEEQTAEETRRSSCSASSVRIAKEEEEEEIESVSEEQQEKKTEEIAIAAAAAENEISQGREENRERSPPLPECLLLMMCEPKLSMEVSRETWVCSTDFLRCRPDRPPGPGPAPEAGKRKEVATASTAPTDELKRTSTDSNPGHPPPNPTQPHVPLPSMATALEQKLVKAVAYEPFVLTRCKSEPVRSSARLAPEACFWKSRKLPPTHQPPLGIGAAGIGF